MATRNIINEFAEDGVRYLELRTTPRQNAETSKKQEYMPSLVDLMINILHIDMTKTSYIEAIISVLQEPRDDIIVRLVVSIDRRNTLEEANEAVDLALAFRSKGVVGVDLCGDVKKGSFDALKPAFDRAKEHGFPVTLHFNEIVENLSEAPSMLAFKPDRLGHATFLDDYCRKTIYERHVPVEICMTSNLLCKTAKTFQDHHIKELIDDRHPFILCVSNI